MKKNEYRGNHYIYFQLWLVFWFTSNYVRYNWSNIFLLRKEKNNEGVME